MEVSNQLQVQSAMYCGSSQGPKCSGQFSDLMAAKHSVRTDTYSGSNQGDIGVVDADILKNMDIQELAEKYNPENMSQDEYDAFLEQLQNKGVVSLSEMEQIGYHDMVAGVPGVSYSDQPLVSSLCIADGNAFRFISSMASVKKNLPLTGGLNPLADSITAIYKKVSSILEQMVQAKNN